ncbi:unnamed protein product [Caenorhabditis brenneri]
MVPEEAVMTVHLIQTRLQQSKTTQMSTGKRVVPPMLTVNGKTRRGRIVYSLTPTTPTPETLLTEGEFMRCDKEKLKKKKVKDLVEELFEFHRIVVVEKCQAVIEMYCKKLTSDFWNSKIQPDLYLRTMECFFNMLHHASMPCLPGEREPVCQLEFVLQKVQEILNNNGFTMNQVGNRMWMEEKEKIRTYPYIKKSSLSYIITFLLDLI